MGSFDSFCGDLIEQSKRFLEKAKETKEDVAKRAFLNASLLLAMSALEAYLNGISNELINMPNINILEKSLLSEKDISLVEGKFEIKNQLKIFRTIERIEFLYRKFSGKKLKGNEQKWWPELNKAIELRNKIVHPKEEFELEIRYVENAIFSVIDCINTLYNVVYDKSLPIYKRGIESKYSF